MIRNEKAILMTEKSDFTIEREGIKESLLEMQGVAI